MRMAKTTDNSSLRKRITTRQSGLVLPNGKWGEAFLRDNRRKNVYTSLRLYGEVQCTTRTVQLEFKQLARKLFLMSSLCLCVSVVIKFQSKRTTETQRHRESVTQDA